MEDLLKQVISLLINSPGNLAYHLVLVFTVTTALQSTWQASGGVHVVVRKRLITGLGVLLGLQALQIFGALLALAGVFSAHQLLPPLDRLAFVGSLLAITWLWLFPQSSRAADFAVLLIGFFSLVVTALGLVWWTGQPEGASFNGAWPDLVAHGLCIIILALGIAGLLSRKPESWELGLATLLILLAGHLGAFWLEPLDQDYSGLLRLAQLAAFPWLLALPQRLSLAPPAPPPAPEAHALDVPERRRYGADAELVFDFVKLLDSGDQQKILVGLPRLFSRLMLADYCLLASPPGDDGMIVISSGYNHIQEKSIEGFTVENRLLPGIADAMRRNRTLRLPASSTTTDLVMLARSLRLARTGPLMVVPVAPADKAVLGIVLISPYANRTWSADDQALLEKMAAYVAQKFLSPAPASTPQAEPPSAAFERGDSPSEQQLRAENQHLVSQFEIAMQQVAFERERAESLAALVQSQAQNPSLSGVDSVSPEDYQLMETELRRALVQITKLEQEINLVKEEARLSAALRPGDAEAKPQPNQTVLDEVTCLVQELRQPLNSVSGHTDMLLGESMGTLGTLQRKFIERIKVAVERMNALIDDLIQVSSLAESTSHLKPQDIDLNAIIDDAIAAAMAPLRQKNIVLRVDIPEDLPLFRADRAALQTVLTHLLQNAGVCTPLDGEISLRAHAEMRDHEPGFIMIQVSDSGGGISPDELPKIFSRLYGGRENIIQGLGISPEELTTVKALVEAHGGRIWVDSSPGQGSTFSALFPMPDEGVRVR